MTGLEIPDELDPVAAQLTYEVLVEAYNGRAPGPLKTFAGQALVFFLQVIGHYNKRSRVKITLKQLELIHD